MSMVLRSTRLLMGVAKAQPSRAVPVASKQLSSEKAKPKTKPKAEGRGAGGLSNPCPVSPAMKKFLGVSEIPRTLAIKKIWEYIKENNLQNPANKKEIICDEKLKTIFEGKANVGFLEVSKLLASHFIKTK
eukprot:Gb_37604 [translate_table: standard]